MASKKRPKPSKPNSLRDRIVKEIRNTNRITITHLKERTKLTPGEQRALLKQFAERIGFAEKDAKLEILTQVAYAEMPEKSGYLALMLAQCNDGEKTYYENLVKP